MTHVLINGLKQKVINLPHSLIEKILDKIKLKLIKKKLNHHTDYKLDDLIEIYDISKFKPTEKLKK